MDIKTRRAHMERTMKRNRFVKLHIIILLITGSFSNCFSKEYIYNFSKVVDMIEHSPMISNIVQDSKGFIWYSSINQLSRYDGYQHLHFEIGINIRVTKMDEDAIKQLVCSNDGLIWGATASGLFCFDTKTFKSIFLGELLNDAQFKQNIVGVQRADDGVIYFSTKSKLYKLSYDSNDLFNDKVVSIELLKEFESEVITSIYNLKEQIAIFTQQGVNLINNHGENERLINWDTLGLKDVMPSSVHFSGHNMLVGTMHHGLLIFDTNWNFQIAVTKEKYPALLTNNIEDINQINDEIWLGTSSGLSRIKFEQEKVQVTNHSMLLTKHVKHRNIHSLFKDNTGVLWIGTYSDGLVKMVSSSIFYRFLGKVKFANAIPYMGVGVQIQMDTNNDIYYLNGNRVEIFKEDRSKNSIRFKNTLVHCFLKDDNRFWLADSSGTYVYSIDDNQAITKKTEIDFLRGVKVSEIVKDKNGSYWVASFRNQTFKFDYENDSIVNVEEVFKPIDAYFLPQIIKPLANGDVLLYLLQKGLYRYVQKTGEIKEIDINQLGANVRFQIASIEEDLDGNIWMGGRRKIYILLGETGKIMDYPQEIPGIIFNLMTDKNGDMWGGNQNRIFRINRDTRKIEYLHNRVGDYEFSFYMNRGVKLLNGDIALCMTNGSALIIYPDRLNEEILKPENNIVLIRVNNKELNVGDVTAGNKEVKTNSAYVEELILSHDEKNISIGFVGSDFSNQDNVQYFYRLKGIEEEWTSVFSGNNFVNYSNLVPGKYEFQVKASYAGIQNAGDTTKLFVRVKHPWYANVWAYMVYTIIVATVVYMLFRYSFDKIKLNQQLDIERFKHDKENELNQMKLQFFTNISHEFKTPLTLLVGPLRHLLDDPMDTSSRQGLYKLMLRNTDRLMRLVNQLMDFRKISNKKYNLRIVFSDICLQLNNLIQAFTSEAENKNITVHIENCESVFCWYDPDVLDKVLNNLLSNAIKYTQEGGAVHVKLSLIDQNIQLLVSDNGIGISNEELTHIFDRFYQASSTSTTRQSLKGTGIGLALVKELVHLHKGIINVESELSKGSSFTVHLPADKAVFSDEDVYDEVNDAFNYEIEKTIPHFENQTQVENIAILDGEQEEPISRKTLLIVEDDVDLREFIVKYLSGSYNIKQAENGLVGLEMAIKVLPDLVISDVMMPELDGLDFCRRLKSDVNISHVPVILLTAKTQLEQQIEGIQIGADAYITKPFDPQYLSTVVANLIESRKKLREKWDRKFIELTPSELALTNADEMFLDKVIGIVEENISNPDFKLEDIYESIGMGRTLFLQKVKSLTNQTCGDFVRSLRLKRAAFLLENHDVRISDLCYDVGFNDPKYFGKVFKKYYGSSPSEYARIKKKVDKG